MNIDKAIEAAAVALHAQGCPARSLGCTDLGEAWMERGRVAVEAAMPLLVSESADPDLWQAAFYRKPAELVDALAKTAREYHTAHICISGNVVEFWNCADETCDRNRELLKAHDVDVVTA